MELWDPLLNDFPKSRHGFLCMIGTKYLQVCQQQYPNNSLGFEYLRKLIQILRQKNHAKAELRYRLLNTTISNTSKIELRHPNGITCTCIQCPRHNKEKEVDLSSDVEEATFLPIVSVS
ncbi:movement protein [Velvet bean golden mosaic virus]|uniref:Protein V2 n=1 Tax=Velvet bean golden mosaic virus TaxID=1881630 RepID=A0A1B1UUE2_9GEMI|nr:movement protein [Velvet bean golden mosaic virus]ANW06442.1 movement protein [Velvet bean golden mosaic virus]ANW06448.1 movement protein [Velvet bean golden mosaic virus]ANW06454.1 movement protein [Velvet bean golden mosaic virus]ANW06460.1 movement protein [Velvet bean golden mosaic virus]ANW06466.1 movement protein [Velvet bean golden mosaic virus]